MIELWLAGIVTIFFCALMIVLEHWGDIQKWRDKRLQEKINRRKIII